jgi:hypothetical protein
MTAHAAVANSDTQQAIDDLRYQRLGELADLGESLWLSIREAAWRKEPLTARAHLGQLRLVTIDALQIVKTLGAEADQ